MPMSNHRDPMLSNGKPCTTESTYWRSILLNAEQNKKLKCDVGGCNKLRHTNGPWCRPHQKRDIKTGSPTGQLPSRLELDLVAKRIRALLRANETHPGIMAAERVCRMWLADAAAGLPGVPAQGQLERLHRKGVTGLELLVRLAAVFYLHRTDSKRFPTEPEFHRAISRSAWGLRPYDYKQNTSSTGFVYPTRLGDQRIRTCKAFEREVLEKLSPALFRICAGLDEATTAAHLAIEAERASLELPADAAAICEIAGLVESK